MKIKVKQASYDEVMAKAPGKTKKPKKPNILFRTLLKVASLPDLIATRFCCKRIGMKQLGRRESALFLMNHSSFIDLEIAASILYPRPFNIVCTTDGFVGKNWLMRQLGCIPTKKFVFDISLVRNMIYAAHGLHSSILMFPEAGYCLDGTAVTLPRSLGKCIKLLGIPVVMIRTYGAFSRDPLYNNLQKRRVKVSADMTYLLSKEQIEQMDPEQINDVLREQFTFDHFRWQKENGVRISEPFRADCLNRVLYRCPHCNTEGQTEGKGTTLTCHACGAVYELEETGTLRRTDGGEGAFSYVTDWFAWERECVRRELLDGSYRLDVAVDIYMLIDTKCLWRVGEGRLVHTADGFTLDGCDGKLHYEQKPLSSYSLNSDFYWYELGDVISIGDHKRLYYCFPRDAGDVVAKTRLAAEELYQLCRKDKDTDVKEQEDA